MAITVYRIHTTPGYSQAPMWIGPALEIRTIQISSAVQELFVYQFDGKLRHPMPVPKHTKDRRLEVVGERNDDAPRSRYGNGVCPNGNPLLHKDQVRMT